MTDEGMATMETQGVAAARSRLSKLLVGVVALAFVVGPSAVSIYIVNTEGWSVEAIVAQVACYAVWTLAAVAFAKRHAAGGPVRARSERRSVPIRVAVLGLSAGAALVAWGLARESSWYGAAFASALWLVASLPGAIRLGVAPAVAATVSLVAGLAMLGSATPLEWELVVAISVTIALAFVFSDRPTVPGQMSADRLGEGVASGQFQLFEGLTLAVGDRVVLDGQSLTVGAGEIVVLVGPSGVGKSVLADVVFGLEGRLENVAVSGQVGVPAAEGSLVFQAGGGLPHLSVDGNLRLVSSHRRRRRALAEEFGLRPRQKTSTLSGGEGRRLAFVRSVLASRGLLWLDEPETGLDLRRVDQLAQLLRQQADQHGMAIVVSTHNVAFAEAIADRVVYLGTDGLLVDLDGDAYRGASDTLEDRIARLLSESAGDRIAGLGTRRREWLRSAKDRLRRRRRVVLECLAQLAESLPFLLQCVWVGPSRSTMVRAFALSWLRGALYYPFIGAIFGLVFVMTFHLVGDRFVVSAATVIQKFGPEMVLRFAPPISAILIGSAAGSTIASWIGQMSVERHLDALEVLGVATRRWVLGPAWWGLFVAAVLHAAAFAVAIILVFVAYVWRMKGGEFPLQLESFLAGFGESGGIRGALAKLVGYSMLVATITVGCAGAPLRDSGEVAGAITRAIIWCSVAVMAVEFVVVAAGLAQ